MTRALVAVHDATYGGVYYSNNIDFTSLTTQPTWTKMATTGLANTLIKVMKNDPVTPYDDIYIQLDNDNVYRWNGVSWTLIMDLAAARVFLGSGEVGYIATNQTDAGKVYWTIQTSAQLKLLYSTDYGATWAAEIVDTDIMTGAAYAAACGSNVVVCTGEIYRMAYTGSIGGAWTPIYLWNNSGGGAPVRIDPADARYFYYRKDSADADLVRAGMGAITEIQNGYNLANDANAVEHDMWIDPVTPAHQKILRSLSNNVAIFATTDSWTNFVDSTPTDLKTGYIKSVGALHCARENVTFSMFGHTGALGAEGLVEAFVGDNPTQSYIIAGTNWNTAPYTNAIPYTADAYVAFQGIWVGEGVNSASKGIYIYSVETDTYDYDHRPMIGDRSAHHTLSYPDEHAEDVQKDTPYIHTPFPGAAGTGIISDGTKWTVSTSTTINEIIRYDPYTSLITNDALPDYIVNQISCRFEALTSVTLAGITYQVYSFWDKNKYLVLAKRVLGGAWTLYTYDGSGGRPSITVPADDNHDVISIGFDPNGFLHVAYHMHDEPLLYRRSDAAISTWTGGLTAVLAMLGGAVETAVTYPTFFNDPAGNLYFLFRYWTVADEGKIYFYKYTHATTTWAAATGTSANGLLISSETITGVTYRAYINKPCFDSTFGSGGYLHISFNWRNVATTENQDLCYVKWDGTNFKQAGGAAQTIPILKSNAEFVETIAAGQGVTNHNCTYSDSSGYPHIAYSRAGTDSFRHVYHAWYSGAAWVIRQISESQAELANPSTNTNYGLQPIIFINRTSDVAYIVYVDDRDAPGLLCQRSGANDFTTWERLVIYPLPTGWYDPKIDTVEWERSKVAYIAIEYWLTDWTTTETSLPIRLLRWDPALNQEYFNVDLHDPVTLDADAGTKLSISAGQQLTYDTQAANTVLAGPTSGAAAKPNHRALVTADLPTATSVDLPYGSFSSNVNQTIASATTAYAITYTDRELTNQITLTSNSHINILVAGTYLITFSAVGKSGVANKYLDIWLAVDGTNVPRSNTHSKFVGSANERIITVTYIYDFTAGQYFELIMHSDDVNTLLAATAAGASPTRPASPSIIVTINKISDTNSDYYLLMETGDRLLLETGDKIFLE